MLLEPPPELGDLVIDLRLRDVDLESFDETEPFVLLLLLLFAELLSFELLLFIVAHGWLQ